MISICGAAQPARQASCVPRAAEARVVGPPGPTLRAHARSGTLLDDL